MVRQIFEALEAYRVPSALQNRGYPDRLGKHFREEDENSASTDLPDQLATGRKLRFLTIVDTFSRFSPGLDVRFTFCGADVVEELESVGSAHGFPARMRIDQGAEFVSSDLDLWAYQRGVTLDVSRRRCGASPNNMRSVGK